MGRGGSGRIAGAATKRSPGGLASPAHRTTRRTHMPQLPLANLLLSAHYLGMRLLGTRSPTWILAAPAAQQNGGGFIHVTPAPTLPGSNLPAILINGLAQLAIAASGIGGIIVGAAAAIINWAVGLGQHASPGSFGG